MQDADDVRKRYDAAKEVSDWFWRVIADARRDSSIFTGLTDQELINFANEMLDLKTYFSHAPFHPPEDVFVSEDTLDRAGAWVISQGRDYFFGVWNTPTLFWSVITRHEYLQGSNYEFAAFHAWDERHGTDIPTI